MQVRLRKWAQRIFNDLPVHSSGERDSNTTCVYVCVLGGGGAGLGIFDPMQG